MSDNPRPMSPALKRLQDIIIERLLDDLEKEMEESKTDSAQDRGAVEGGKK